MKEKQKRYVLDSWAILAFLQGEEPAASRVKKLLKDANDEAVYLVLSVINLGEIFYIVGRAKGEEAAYAVVRQLQETNLDILPIAQDDVLSAAKLKMNYAISYADAFAAASASTLNATLVTGDPELIALATLIDVEPLERH